MIHYIQRARSPRALQLNRYFFPFVFKFLITTWVACPGIHETKSHREGGGWSGSGY